VENPTLPAIEEDVPGSSGCSSAGPGWGKKHRMQPESGKWPAMPAAER